MENFNGSAFKSCLTGGRDLSEQRGNSPGSCVLPAPGPSLPDFLYSLLSQSSASLSWCLRCWDWGRTPSVETRHLCPCRPSCSSLWDTSGPGDPAPPGPLWCQQGLAQVNPAKPGGSGRADDWGRGPKTPQLAGSKPPGELGSRDRWCLLPCSITRSYSCSRQPQRGPLGPKRCEPVPP